VLNEPHLTLFKKRFLNLKTLLLPGLPVLMCVVPPVLMCAAIRFVLEKKESWEIKNRQFVKEWPQVLGPPPHGFVMLLSED
jgi:hypothetical protein